MKKIKNTGFRITITLNADDSLHGNRSTSTAHYMVGNLLGMYELYDTTIKEIPGIIYAPNCSFFTATLLQVDFHAPYHTLPDSMTEDLAEYISKDVYVQKYEMT